MTTRSIPTAAWAASIPRTESRAKRWQFAETDRAQSAALAQALEIAEPLAVILTARGITDADAAHAFLNPKLSGLYDPLLLTDMGRAIERLRAAIQQGEKIEIHGDYDVDGTTSTVILKTAIEMAGGRAGFWIPHRLKDGYGLRDSAIDRAAENGVKLIVSVDTGIRARDAVERARELGIDVIVTDHHLPESELPPALAVINPNRADCTYPEKNLCGAGVAFKVAQALLGTLGWPREKLDRMLASFLKLVAIATVADVVPLTGENRIIVWYGLRGLADVRNPGLRALLDAAGVTEGCAPTTHQVGFRIAPRINAAGRMASASEVVDLFLSADQAKGREIAERLSALNGERQDEEARVIELILAECESLVSGVTAPALVFAGEGWHRGVLGIVASRLVERFCRPVFVLGIENGEAAGSGRSISAFHLLESLESMAPLFVKFGGHRQAAGATMDSGRVAEFRESFAAYAARMLKPEDFEPVQRVDAQVNFRQINERFWRALSSLEPFGMGNPTPVFAATDVEIANEPVLMKEKHVRFAAAQEGRVITFKGFNMAHRAGELQRGARVDLAFRIDADDFRGGWCATVCDFRSASARD
jgi:single-stranded-DNA-specific exonuclease